MLRSGLTTGSGGNLSIFNKKEGLIAITPSGVEYPDMTVEDIILLDINGNIDHSDESEEDFSYNDSDISKKLVLGKPACSACR